MHFCHSKLKIQTLSYLMQIKTIITTITNANQITSIIIKTSVKISLVEDKS